MLQTEGPPTLGGSSPLVQTCTSNIKKMTLNTAQIRKMVNRLGTGQDSYEMQECLQQVQRSTNELAKETEKHLKGLGALPLPSSPSDLRYHKVKRDRLINDFSAALNSFQAVQRRAAEKKELVAQVRGCSWLSSEDHAWDQKLVAFEHPEDLDTMSTQGEEEAMVEEVLGEREPNLRELESDIMDVNYIFKDLAVMIHDQGDVKDGVEAKVDKSDVHVEGGAERLQRAASYQLRSRRKMLILALVISGGVVILSLVIWLGLK